MYIPRHSCEVNILCRIFLIYTASGDIWLANLIHLSSPGWNRLKSLSSGEMYDDQQELYVKKSKRLDRLWSYRKDEIKNNDSSSIGLMKLLIEQICANLSIALVKVLTSWKPMTVSLLKSTPVGRRQQFNCIESWKERREIFKLKELI